MLHDIHLFKQLSTPVCGDTYHHPWFSNNKQICFVNLTTPNKKLPAEGNKGCLSRNTAPSDFGSILKPVCPAWLTWSPPLAWLYGSVEKLAAEFAAPLLAGTVLLYRLRILSHLFLAIPETEDAFTSFCKATGWFTTELLFSFPDFEVELGSKSDGFFPPNDMSCDLWKYMIYVGVCMEYHK